NPMKRSTIVTFCLLLAGSLPLPCSAAVDPASPTLKRVGEMATLIPDIRSLPLSEPPIVDEGSLGPRSPGSGPRASGRAGAAWRYVRPLQASAGVTALAGQVLTVGGQPLADVTLTLGSASTRSDSTGRFLLTELEGGHDVLRIDGSTASRPGRTYGLFEAGV